MNHYFLLLFNVGWRESQSVYVPRKLDIDDIVDVSAGDYHSMFLDEYGNVYTCGYLGKFEKRKLSLLAKNSMSIKCCFTSSIMKSKDKVIYVWGENDCGNVVYDERQCIRTPEVFKM